ncbi:MAG: hypothetical protein K2J13_04425, partial [Clostridia bacterium]|nr:hypothetical protein [Clostridia bacterium]
NIPGTATSIIDIYNTQLVTVDSGANITNTLRLNNSNLMVLNYATLSTVELDKNSNALVSGAITTSLDGGNQVIMQEGHSCDNYQNINALVIYRDIKKSHVIKNCRNVIYVEKLAKPVDINIQEREDSRIFCNVASVKYASGYSLYINDEFISTNYGEDNTEFEITNEVKNIGTYKVSVVPIGNYTLGELNNAGHCTKYVDGDAAVAQYNCEMTLQAPKNLRVTESADGIWLDFDSVPHAKYYMIYVDGIMVVRDDLTSTREELSRYVGVIGDHSIRVQAFSLQENILPSSESMISYSAIEKLEAVDELTATLNVVTGDEVKSAKIIASWQGTANGYDYIVYLQTNGNKDSRIEVGRTSVLDETGAIVYTIEFEEWNIDYNPESDTYFEVIVVAAEHDYFTQSDESICRVKKPIVSTSAPLSLK